MVDSFPDFVKECVKVPREKTKRWNLTQIFSPQMNTYYVQSSLLRCELRLFMQQQFQLAGTGSDSECSLAVYWIDVVKCIGSCVFFFPFTFH